MTPDDEVIERLAAQLRVSNALASGYLDRLCEAKALLRSHGESNVNCPGCAFKKSNKYLPANHPAWASSPEHNCWPVRVENFLKD